MTDLTDAQLAHVLRLRHETAVRIENKYRRGQEEHGGNLFGMAPRQLLDNAIDEAIDQIIYLLTLRDAMDAWDSDVVIADDEAPDCECGHSKADHFAITGDTRFGDHNPTAPCHECGCPNYWVEQG